MLAMRAAGFRSQSDFARSAGLPIPYINGLVCMRSNPIKRDGRFTDTAKQIMEVLGACPSDLWSGEQLCTGLENPDLVSAVEQHSAEEKLTGMAQLDPSVILEGKQEKSAVDALLSSLSRKEAIILRMRYWHGEYSYDTIAQYFGVSRTWIMQIEARAMRKINHPSRMILLNGVLDGSRLNRLVSVAWNDTELLAAKPRNCINPSKTPY